MSLFWGKAVFIFDYEHYNNQHEEKLHTLILTKQTYIWKIDKILTFLTYWNDLTDTKTNVCVAVGRKCKFPTWCNSPTYSRPCKWLTLPGSQSVPSIGGSSLVLHSASPSTLHHRPVQRTCCRKSIKSEGVWSTALSLGQQCQLLWCKQKCIWVKIYFMYY